MNDWTNFDPDDPRQAARAAEWDAARQQDEDAAHQRLWEAVQQAMQREGARP